MLKISSAQPAALIKKHLTTCSRAAGTQVSVEVCVGHPDQNTPYNASYIPSPNKMGLMLQDMLELDTTPDSGGRHLAIDQADTWPLHCSSA